MPKTSYHRVASSVVEMLEELSAQVMKRHVQLTTHTVSPLRTATERDRGKPGMNMTGEERPLPDG